MTNAWPAPLTVPAHLARKMSHFRHRMSGECRGSMLVEVLVSMLLTLMLVAVMYSAFVGQVRTYAAQNQLMETTHAARLAMQVLTGQIMQAGFGAPPPSSGTGVPAILTATSSALSFVSDVRGAQTFLAAPAAKNSHSLAVVSSAAFAAGNSIYLTDGTNWYTGSVTAVNANVLTVSAGLSVAFAAGSVVNAVETVTFTFSQGQLVRNGQSLLHNVTALAFSYDSSNLGAIRRIGITLTAQVRAPDRRTVQPTSVTVSTEVAPKNLRL